MLNLLSVGWRVDLTRQVNCSPAASDSFETTATLQFASRVACIKTKPTVQVAVAGLFCGWPILWLAYFVAGLLLVDLDRP